MKSRLVSSFAWSAAALATGLLVLAALVAWRLSQGPIPLDVLAPRLEAAMSQPEHGLHVRIGRVLLHSVGRLEVRAEEVRIVDGDGTTLVSTPDLRVALSPRALLRGALAPTRIELSGIRVRLVRLENGELQLGLGRPTGLADAPSDGFAEWLVDDLFGDPHAGSALASLRRIAVRGAQVTVLDRVLGRSWRVPEADFALFRDAAGVAATLGASLGEGGRRQRADLAAAFDPQTGLLSVDLRVRRMRPDQLVEFAPALAPLAALRLPLDGYVSAQLTRRGELRRASLSLDGGAGELVPSAGGGSLPVERMRLRAAATGPGELQLQELSLDLPGATVRASGRAERSNGGYAVALEVEGLPAATLASLAPGLLQDADVALDLGGRLDLTLGDDGALRQLAFDIAAGQGRFSHAELFPEPVPVAAFSATGGTTEDFGRITVDQFALDLGGPRIEGSATLDLLSAGAAVQAALVGRDVPTDALARLWPRGAAAGARSWVIENLSGGRVHEVRATLAAVTTDNPARPLPVVMLAGDLRFSGVTARYWQPLPPFSEVAGSATFTEKRFDLKLDRGRHGGVAVQGGTLAFTGLDRGRGHEHADIEVAMAGPLSEILAVLDRPPLGYAKWLGVAPGEAKGTAEATLEVKLPLLKDVEFDQIDIAASGSVAGAELPDVALGQSLSDADLRLAIDKSRLTLAGTGRLGGVAVSLDGIQRFDDAETVRGSFRLAGILDPAAREALGIEAHPYIGGSVPTRLALTEARDGTSILDMQFDLEPASLAIPELAWRKPAGAPGTAAARLRLAAGKPQHLEALTVSAGDLQVSGSGSFDPASGGLAGLDLARVRLGERNDLRLHVASEGEGYRVTASGAAFDLRPLIAGWRNDKGTPPSGDGRRLTLAVDIARVWIDEELPIDGLRGTLTLVGDDLRTADLVGSLGGVSPTRFTAVETGDRQTMVLTGEDFGSALRVLGVVETVVGGRFEVTAKRETNRADAPFAGEIVATDFRVSRAPLAARLFASASLTGLSDLASADAGIGFRRLAAPFVLSGSSLELRPGRAYGSAVGVTFRGGLDFAEDSIEVAGTLVPAYSVNRVIGAIPLLGPVLTGERGGGVFAATYRLSGPLEEPQISINPLAVLAPGFLRGLFGAMAGSGEGDWDPALDPAAQQRMQKAN